MGGPIKFEISSYLKAWQVVVKEAVSDTCDRAITIPNPKSTPGVVVDEGGIFNQQFMTVTLERE